MCYVLPPLSRASGLRAVLAYGVAIVIFVAHNWCTGFVVMILLPDYLVLDAASLGWTKMLLMCFTIPTCCQSAFRLSILLCHLSTIDYHTV